MFAAFGLFSKSAAPGGRPAGRPPGIPGIPPPAPAPAPPKAGTVSAALDEAPPPKLDAPPPAPAPPAELLPYIPAGAYLSRAFVPPPWLNTGLLCTLRPSCMLYIIGAIIYPKGVDKNSAG